MNENIVKTILLKNENLVSPILSTDNVIGHVSTYLEEIPNGTLFSAKNSNDPMEPRIPNGATIMIHEQEQVDSNEAAAILVNQDIKFRRIEKIAGTTWLIPENSKYKPQILGENQIIGKAINYVGTL
ncbi:S24 family peptidase [Lactobacillus sp. ESL0680]|uniref:LexA family protein n=1 Tax=Lactobacillus sp. ESL0680 TaxID=2983210 RepID=UPI0023F63CA2|nr:S24 family peptidase [Lactobacillus sp. ESL0680]WEV38626.1 S24 family peptidase [Lactobacillus sp. ESL0680]